MTPPANTARYKNQRFPGEISSHGVWLYSRYPLRYRDVQELLSERGITVSHEAIRPWCQKIRAGLRESAASPSPSAWGQMVLRCSVVDHQRQAP